MKLPNIFSALAISALLIVFSVSSQAQVTVIKAGKLVDPETGSTSTDAIIVVENGKIKSVGAKLPIPANARIIDLTNSTVLPGLFDAHTHLCGLTVIRWDAGDFLFMNLRRRTGFRAIQGIVHAHEMLAAGFTTVRDVGNAGDYADIDVRNAINDDLVPGPTMISAGRIIGPFGGQFELRPDKSILANNSEYLFADTQDEMRKAVRENIYYGATVIKIVVDAQKYMYTVDDIRFIVNEAAAAGLKVAAHCQTEEGERRAAEAGVASIEHGWYLPNDVAELMKKNNVVLVSTDATVKVLKGFGWNETDAKEIHADRVDRLKRAYRAGVTIAFGTDVMVKVPNETYGTLAIGYIDSFVEAGFPPLKILQIMTANPARLLGVEKGRGAIAPGKYVDIIATPENPLDSIQTLKHVSFVMKNGKVIAPLSQ
jgi:imidazolonepropionase-like amidohydrolase